ncbi:unnamed protein product [Cladocopium goreaui]|uniref:Anthranilate N-benzoyltransferase protein 2 n=1 Tax=Cladocopium goreaui TaxID=2562237 RepID=A0A9P1BHF1_9DINO|nr:unnamed protein product [Cladocopium goreaui]
MGCFQWLFGQSRSSTEVIRPSMKLYDGPTEMIVPKGEQMFGMMPLCFATYPAIALRLPKCDEKRLKQSLSKALDLVPKAAGRYKEDGEIIQLNGAGVPFTVVKSSEESAPVRIEEKRLLDLATFHRPWSVRQGLCAAAAIKLTIYKDGSGVLAFSRSHMLFDGGSAWTFLGIWASLAKGDSVKAPAYQQDYMQRLLPGDGEFQELAMKKYGVSPKASIFSKVLKRIVIPLVGAIMDTFFLHGGWSLTRHRLFFSDDDLARLKEEATPKEVPANMDNWVTTQEALCAHMLLAFRPLLKKDSAGDVQMMFLLDARKALSLPSNQIMGNGLTFTSISIPTQQVLSMDLPGLASHLHQALSVREGSLESQKELWRTITGACHRGVENDIMRKIHKMKNIDLKFAVNNSSKRTLPDFGSGRCQSVITNAGPTIFLPADGGIEVHLDPSVFSSAGCTKAQREEALRAMTALPKKVQ